MKAVRDKITKQVAYLFDEYHIVRLTPHGMRSPEIDPNITQDEYEVVSAPNPANFVPDLMAFDGGWSIVDEQAYNDALAELSMKAAEAERLRRIEEIKDQYKTHPPVEVNGVLWSGGDSSASAINGAIQLAQAAGESDTTLWDVYDQNHENISFEYAAQIAKSIALAYRTRMLERNNKIAAITV